MLNNPPCTVSRWACEGGKIERHGAIEILIGVESLTGSYTLSLAFERERQREVAGHFKEL
jgi:hypothetical protein